MGGPACVMAGHSRPKDGVASARLCPAIHVLSGISVDKKTWMPGTSQDKPGHDGISRLSTRRALPLSPCGRGWPRCEAARTGEGSVSAHSVSAEAYPSSGASRHLLPQGEKGKTAAPPL